VAGPPSSGISFYHDAAAYFAVRGGIAADAQVRAAVADEVVPRLWVLGERYSALGSLRVPLG
jgi:hypothetical protein